MKTSVVIPAYNAANTIGKALASCMQQSYLPYEIIVVDDSSTDGTVAAAVQAHNKDIKVIEVKKNSGPSHARNLGISASSGEIIAFLDADDIWHPDKLLILSRIFTQNSNIQFLGHPYTLGKFKDIEYEAIPEKKSYLSILASNPFQSSCIAIRKILPEKFNENMRYCEDHELALRTAYREGCYMLPAALTMLGRPQLTAGGASANLWKMRMGELQAYTSVWKHNPLFVIFIPLLWVFSLLKLARLLLSK